ncbi:MAG: GlxA family transcriptional regulator [Pseudomonadota bacterium]
MTEESGAATAIGVLAYPGSQACAVHGLSDLFAVANGIAEESGASSGPAFSVSHWAVSGDGGDVVMTDGPGEGGHQQLGALIAPPCLGEQGPEAFAPPVLAWIQRQHGGGAVICSICAGAFLLGEAGLLNGRAATTHWALAEQFADRFKGVRLETDKLIVDDGDIITAGGVMAWVDLGLRLVDRFVGPTVMLDVARFFLVDPSGREQRFYSAFAPSLGHGDEPILAVQHWLQTNSESAVTIASMSSVAGLSERTFLRRFQKATGLKPTAYVQSLRVGRARELLEQSSLPFNQIAWKVGYEDPAAFSKVFQRIMGLAPGEYRRRFSVG